jgi:predicted DNA-binding transcriptional regulator AlpA
MPPRLSKAKRQALISPTAEARTPAVLSVRDLTNYLGLSRATVYRLLPALPPRVRLSERRLGWRRADVDRWLEARLTEAA